MSKKRLVRTPYTDHIRTIWLRYIKPLAELLVVNGTVELFTDGVHILFGSDYRSVLFMRATRAFTIPGKLWYRDSIWVYGSGDRRVHKNEVVLVRTDTRTPDEIDLEYKEELFKLTANEYAGIKYLLTKIG